MIQFERWEGDVWGPWWLGLMKVRVYLTAEDYKTFWHVSIWKFTIGMSFPASFYGD